MTTPNPGNDSATERFEPVPADSAPPAFAAPEPAAAPAPPVPPGAVPSTTFAAPEPGSFPTQPVRAGAAGVASPSAAGGDRGGSGVSLLNVVLGIAILIAVAGVSFAIGRTSSQAETSPVANSGSVPNAGPNANGGAGPLGGAGPNASFDLNGNGGPGGDRDGDRGFFGGRPFGIGGLGIQGTVTAVDGSSVTIRTADGATITVGTDGSTQYHQQADAQASDVQAGKTVIITLADGFRPGRGADANGSITLGTAGSITVVP